MDVWCKVGYDTDSHIKTTGWLFYDDKLYRGEQILEVFESINLDNRDEFESRLRDCNGSFAVVVERSEETILAADHVQNVPLFYSIQDGTIYVSSRLGDLVDELGVSPARDCIQFVELLASDMVLGRDTVFPDVYQVQTAEVVYIEDSEPGYTVDRSRYRLYRDEPNESTDKEALMNEMDRSLEGAIHRLVRVANGDPIILKLSAGYDSRLIALLLAQHGYDEVHAVHIDHSSTRADTVRDISNDLGIPLTVLSYDHEDVRSMYLSEDWDEISSTIGRGATSHLSPASSAVDKKISDRDDLPDSGIVVDGGMAAAGTMVHPKLTRGNLSIDDVINDILVKNFHNYEYDTKRRPRLGERIRAVTDLDSNPSPEEAIRARERWYWQERANKRLARHPFAFKYWGFDSWQPLWDVEYMTFFDRVPLNLRVQKRLHVEYVEDRYRSHVGRFPKVNESTTLTDKLLSVGKNMVLDSPLEHPVRSFFYPLQKRVNKKRAGARYEDNPKLGFVPKGLFESEYTGSEYYRYFLNALEFEVIDD